MAGISGILFHALRDADFHLFVSFHWEAKSCYCVSRFKLEGYLYPSGIFQPRLLYVSV